MNPACHRWKAARLVNESESSADRPLKPALPRSVKVVGLASLLNDAASEMIFPLLPHFLLTVLQGNRFYLGVIEGIADAVAGFVKIWSGDRSDQAGHRKGFIIFGYGVPSLARPLIGLVTVPWQLFAIRVVDRIGKGTRSSPRDALIADATDPSMHGRAFGFHRAMDNLGAAVGPLLASAFLWYRPDELRTLFLLAIVPGLIVVALVVFGLREKAVASSPKQRFRLTLKPFDRNFKLYLAALVVFTLGNSSDAFLLVRAGELGVAPITLPLLWCVCHVAKSAGNLLLGRVVDLLGARPALLAGWLVFAVVYGAFAWATNVEEIWIAFIGYGLACGLIEPAEKALVVQVVGTERKGLAFGWYNFAIGIAVLPSSLICGALYQHYGPAAAFSFGAAAALAAVAMLAGVVVRPLASRA